MSDIPGRNPSILVIGRCLHLESLAVVVAIILGCLPGSVRALVFQVVNLHLDVLVEGRNVSGELIALVQTLEMIFANIEGSPHIAHDRDAHDRRAEANKLAYLRIDIANLALTLGNLNGLLQEDSSLHPQRSSKPGCCWLPYASPVRGLHSSPYRTDFWQQPPEPL